jgi:hypothetical protein
MSDESVVPWSWQKSSFSGEVNCVEVRRLRRTVQVRHSRNKSGPVLEFSDSEWRAFLAGVTAGEFSLPD